MESQKTLSGQDELTAVSRQLKQCGVDGVVGYKDSWKTTGPHPCIQGQLIFDKVPRHDGKDSLFNE